MSQIQVKLFFIIVGFWKEKVVDMVISVSVAYTLVDTTSPVDVEVTELFFSSNVIASRMFTF